MAKTNAPKFKGQKDFKSGMEFLSQFSSDSQILEDYKEIEPSFYIHSGNYLYNAHISGSLLRGFANNKIYTIAGDPKTGKSFLVYNGMREAQKLGFIIYFFETENAVDKDRLVEQGIDISKVVFEQPEIVDGVIIPTVRLTEQLLKEQKAGKELPKIMIVVDSTTGLNSKKQYADAMEGEAKQDMGTVAKDLKRMFSMLSVRCGRLGIPIICTAHVYEKQMKGFSRRTATGGQGAIFMSSVVSMLRKTDDRDEDRQRIGLIVTSDIVESRFSKPVSIQFYLNFKQGMNPYYGLNKYISWDACGICKGKMVEFVDLAAEMMNKKALQKASFTTKKFTKADMKKELSKAKGEVLEAYLIHHLDNGLLEHDGDSYKFTEKCKKAHYDSKDKFQVLEGKKVHFPNASSTHWIAKHLDEAFPTNKMFKDNVFTKDVLKQLDENVIIPLFRFEKEDLSGEEIEEANDDAANSMDDFLSQGDE